MEDFFKECMPYVVLLETDGGPDRNIKFLRNVLSLFTVFLVSETDKLTSALGCPGHSYLNVAERCMSILNPDLANLALSQDPDAPVYLFDLLHGSNSMNAFREAVAQYDAELDEAIVSRERFEARKRAREEDDVDGTIPNNDVESDTEVELVELDVDEKGVYPVGYKTTTFFDTWGWFKGEVKCNEDKKYKVAYEDGDVHIWSQKQIDD